MFETLSERLETTFRGLTGRGKLTEDDIRKAMVEVRRALLEADVNTIVAEEFVNDVTEEALGAQIMTSLTPGQQVIKIVNDKLVELLGGEDENTTRLNIVSPPPTIIMMVGLQGSGKTTTAGKLALHLRGQKHRPLLVACDIYRPAAIDQLQTLGRQLDIPVYSEGNQVAPPLIAQHAIAQAKKNNNTVVIIDTAGRLQIDEPLMQELQQLKGNVGPHEILLVVDAMTGQESVNVAMEFNNRVGITGLIVTKMDGDARGGSAMSVRAVTGVPIKYMGVGEKLDALEQFYPDRIAQRILGMGDILTLIERAQAAYDAEEAEKLQEKMKKGKFDLDDFLKQMKSIRKMGPLGSLLGMLPGMGKQMKELRNALETPEAEAQLRRTEAIILSMTRKERAEPEIINASRRRRIATGSGTSVADVNELLQQFKVMRQMMQGMSKGGGMNMANMGSMLGSAMGGPTGMMPGMGGGSKKMVQAPRDPLADFKKGARPNPNGAKPVGAVPARAGTGGGAPRPPKKKKK
ncbi:MAG TPA: signal recognition particle protein [Chloroflexia bacterium]|nr:signal recognition particle protein [Chloroflexia bacterium]